MPPFKLEESYQKPEERIPSDIAEIRAHPEMVGFNVEEFRKKLEGDTIYTHPEGDPMREMEVLARQDKINFEVDIAEAEHKGFLEQARYDIEKYYRDLEKKPEVEFKKQLDQAVDKLVLKIENANNIANDLQRYPNLKFIVCTTSNKAAIFGVSFKPRAKQTIPALTKCP